MNSCDGCTECCSLFEIQEIQKPANKTCGNCVDSKCSIYESRPKACSEFKCIYIQSNWMEAIRPDKCGVMFSLSKSGEFQAIILREDYDKKLVDLHIQSCQITHGVKFNLVKPETEAANA